jgi:hypothetical protein
VASRPTGPDRDASGAASEPIRKHLERGAPWDACDAFREAIARFPGDELLWRRRPVPAQRKAHALLDRAQAAPSRAAARLADILSLRGRLWKDGFHRAQGSAAATMLGERARGEYLAAYRLQQDPYPGINAATLSLLLGDRAEATRLAREVERTLAAQSAPRGCWDHATAGEAARRLGHSPPGSASRRLPSRGDAGSVASMWRQVGLIARSPGGRGVVAAPPGGVLRSMIDAPPAGLASRPRSRAP